MTSSWVTNIPESRANILHIFCHAKCYAKQKHDKDVKLSSKRKIVKSVGRKGIWMKVDGAIKRQRHGETIRCKDMKMHKVWETETYRDIGGEDSDMYTPLVLINYRNVPIRSALPNRSPPAYEPYGIHTHLHTCTVKHGTCCSKSQWWPPKLVSLLLACLNRHKSKYIPWCPKWHGIEAPSTMS